MRILQIRREATPNFLFHETIADPRSFISAIRNKLSEKHRAVIDAAANRQKDVAEILKIAGIKLDTTTQSPESQILKAIVDYESNKSGATNKEFLQPQS